MPAVPAVLRETVHALFAAQRSEDRTPA